MHIASLPAAWADMTADALEDALLETVIRATEAHGSVDNTVLVLVDEYFATALEPEDETARRRDLMVLLLSLLEPQPLVTC